MNPRSNIEPTAFVDHKVQKILRTAKLSHMWGHAHQQHSAIFLHGPCLTLNNPQQYIPAPPMYLLLTVAQQATDNM
jgi:hypothetical protein